MPKFRKKPVVIEAIQFTGTEDNETDVLTWARSEAIALMIDQGAPSWFQISTLEGVMRADAGDWIIRGIKGELYPCKADVFAATYDSVE